MNYKKAVDYLLNFLTESKNCQVCPWALTIKNKVPVFGGRYIRCYFTKAHVFKTSKKMCEKAKKSLITIIKNDIKDK